MLLQSGTRIGRYEIVQPIGAGGMGEVYRARDTTLDRMAAIKVLPEVFSQDPERVARFEREAKSLASLNHPNIAQIYGTESSESVRALAMELVQGEELAERLERGALPVNEALLIARQIADALETAHEQGIIHRDLKPANVKITADGMVKVLDFGLAKAFDPASAASGASDPTMMNSPTISIGGTAAGLIVGTAAYMAPEQARGQAIDRRVDVWAFGVVLFEMLAGRRAFDGETISDVLASVLKNDLDWTQLPADVPVPVIALLRRCLTPDRRNRLRDIGEARIAITEFLARPTDVAPPPAATRRAPGRRWWYAATAILAIALVAALGQLWRGRRDSAPIVRYLVHLPPNAVIGITLRPSLSFSPDGRQLVFAAAVDGVSRLYVQRRDDFDIRLLPATEGASDPVVSPDGQSLAFVTEERLMVMRFEGSPLTVAKVNNPRGLTWADNSTLVYTPETTSGIFEISTSGGAPKPLTKVNTGAGERSHRWPHVLPGGRHVLFTVGVTASPDNYNDSPIDVVDRQTGERRTVLPAASMARYAPTGHLVYVRNGALFAIPFDLQSVSTRGAAVPVLQGVGADVTTGAAHIAWANDGTLAYVTGDLTGGLRQLVWVDRKGQAVPVDLRPGDPSALFNDPRISPDGSRVALAVGTTGQADIWVYHFERRTFTRLTSTGTNATPVWSADGRSIYYVSILPTGRRTTVLRMDAEGGAEGKPLVSFDVRAYLKFVSADGAWAVAEQTAFAGNKSDIVRLTLGAQAGATKLAATSSDELGAAVSSDARWLAYQSDDSGRREIYVRAVDGTGGRFQVSNAGGEEAMWARSGRELYYRVGGQLMAVPVETQPVFRSGVPSLLFTGVYNLRSDTGISYDLDPKGNRLLMLRKLLTDESGTIRIVRNWFDELRRITQTR